jgi:5-methylcytosine-specific restriction endonuclease McrA
MRQQGARVIRRKHKKRLTAAQREWRDAKPTGLPMTAKDKQAFRLLLDKRWSIAVLVVKGRCGCAKCGRKDALTSHHIIPLSLIHI